MAEAAQASWQLPLSVVGPVDVGRLIRELEALDNFLLQAAIREPGTAIKMPKTSRLMDELLQLNKLNVLLEPERQRLKAFLVAVRDRAPVLNISFSADPSPLFMQKIMIWLRKEISPSVLVRVGLQPNIGAGCVIRTPNKYLDLSLRQRFTKNRSALVKKLEEIQVAQAAAQPPVTATTPTPVPVAAATATTPAPAAPAPATPAPAATAAPVEVKA